MQFTKYIISLKALAGMLCLFFSISITQAQNNVGIGTNAPDASALLDLQSIDKGFLAPRLTIAQRLAIPAPANGLLVYDINLECYFFYNAVSMTWGSLCNGFPGPPGPQGPPGPSTANAWDLLGNGGTNSSLNFLGTLDNKSLVFRVNNIPRLTLNVNSQALAVDGTSALPFYSFSNNTGLGMFRAGTNILGFSTNGIERMRIMPNGRATINNAVTDGQLDVRGNMFTAFGGLGTVYGHNYHWGGNGVIGIGQNASQNAIQNGAGGCFVGNTLGVAVIINHTVNSSGIYIQNSGLGIPFVWSIGSIVGSTTVRKIIGAGVVSTVVDDLEGNRVMLNSPESPECLYVDYGVGQLKDGYALITIDPILSKNIIVDEEHPLKVFIQPEGDCNGVYVKSKSIKNFEVQELNQGKSNISFSYQIVATMGDQVYKDKNGKEHHFKFTNRWDKAPENHKLLSDIDNESKK